MKQIGFILIIFFVFSSCTTSKKMTANQSSGINTESRGREGSSFENPVVLKEKDETTGVAAEYEWLRNHYPGYTTGKQTLSVHKKKPYDIISIRTTEGKEIEVYFDISNFYGKF
ncbi:MAG: hypothetical protein NTU44_11860 [Bacteroidetes bacterium]|nr:hypothetical protein [Bacteroidota bacterium]